jgi:hypothetical protein
MKNFYISHDHSKLLVIGSKWSDFDDFKLSLRYNCDVYNLNTNTIIMNDWKSTTETQLLDNHFKPLSDKEGKLLLI